MQLICNTLYLKLQIASYSLKIAEFSWFIAAYYKPK